MVVQKSWGSVDTPPVEETPSVDTSGSSWSFPVASEKATNVRTVPATTSNAAPSNPPVTRQIAINTLAAMHKRFSLPGPMQPHSRPIAEFRASANKSLDMLRQTIQSAVSRDIDQVIKKYLEKFFVPAVNNIRLNLGEESVSEDQVRAVCRAMLDATRLMYNTPRHAQAPTLCDNGESDVASTIETKFAKPSTLLKRKEPESEVDFAFKRQKIKEEIVDNAVPSLAPNHPLKDPDKWNPARFTPDTLFIMGSHAHKVLGLGNSRGRLYTKHATLPRYAADSADKEWIANHSLAAAVGGKTYIMVLEDIEELAKSDAYRHTSLPLLGELSGFKVPPFILKKIKAYVAKRSFTGEVAHPESPEKIPSQTTQIQFNAADIFKEDIKLEPLENEVDSNDIIANIGNGIRNREFDDALPLMKDGSDFADIKMDETKVDDIDDIKVEGIKVEDELDVDIKVENLEDIREEDIKLENDDTLSVCKQTEDEQNNLEDGLLDSDIEFLSRNLVNIESDADARKTIEKLTGANPDTITLVGDEFDLGPTLNTNIPESPKFITVGSSVSGVVHAVPVSALARPRRSTLHYYSCVPPAAVSQPTAPQPTVPHTTAPVVAALHRGQQTPSPLDTDLMQGIPINSKPGTFSTVLSQGTASIIGFTRATNSNTVIGTSQYVNVNAKTFPTGNILHNAIMSRKIINRSLSNASTAVTYSITTVRPVIQTTAPKMNTVVSTTSNDYDAISTTKDMIDNACNSSVMLKKVLTLGSAGVAKSFMIHNSQKVLSTGFVNGVTPPPNVTIVSSGTAGGSPNVIVTSNVLSTTSSNLSATHATLSALLASTENTHMGKK